MGSGERRERDRIELRGRILDAAREIFVAEGYEAVTMRRIADKIEYSPAAIYFHFDDKKALINELVSNDVGALQAELGRIAKVSDPIERIRKLGHAYVEFAHSYPRHYRLIFMAEFPTTPEHGTEVPERDDDLDGYAMMRSAVIAAMNAKLLKPEFKDADLLVQTLWAGWHGVASLRLTRGEVRSVPWRPRKEVARLMIDTLINGLTSGRQPARRPETTIAAPVFAAARSSAFIP